MLAWNASSGQRPIDYYSLYRDGAMVGQSAALGSTDSGLTADTRYSYFVTATDTQGNQSLPSEGLEVSTSGGRWIRNSRSGGRTRPTGSTMG